MGQDTRVNWADTIIHKLNRLSIASGLTKEEIYESFQGIMSDATIVNKGLAAEISGKLGLRWIPGQLYCCIHTVLGWQDGMVKNGASTNKNFSRLDETIRRAFGIIKQMKDGEGTKLTKGTRSSLPPGKNTTPNYSTFHRQISITELRKS